jgi:hypothetical protein
MAPWPVSGFTLPVHVVTATVHDNLYHFHIFLVTFYSCSGLVIRVHMYSLPSIIRLFESRRMKFAGHVAYMGKKRNAYWILMGKTKGNRPLGRSRCRWKDNIEMDLRKMGWGDMDWIALTQDREQWRALVNTVMNLQVS